MFPAQCTASECITNIFPLYPLYMFKVGNIIILGSKSVKILLCMFKMFNILEIHSYTIIFLSVLSYILVVHVDILGTKHIPLCIGG